MDTLNAEHGVVEDRWFIRQRTTAIGLTLAVATLMACAMAVVLIGKSEGFSGLFLCGFPLAWKAIQWPVALACILFGLALIYYFAPNLKQGVGLRRERSLRPASNRARMCASARLHPPMARHEKR